MCPFGNVGVVCKHQEAMLTAKKLEISRVLLDKCLHCLRGKVPIGPVRYTEKQRRAWTELQTASGGGCEKQHEEHTKPAHYGIDHLERKCRRALNVINTDGTFTTKLPSSETNITS